MKPLDVYETAAMAVELIGNDSSRISRFHREKIVTSVNKSLLPLAKKEPYTEGAGQKLGEDIVLCSQCTSPLHHSPGVQ